MQRFKVGDAVSKRYPKVKTALAEQPKAAAKKAPKGDEEAKQKANEAARMAVMLAPCTLSALPAAPPPVARKRKAEHPPAPAE
eukprot:793383-Prymnesium_polylepis.1